MTSNAKSNTRSGPGDKFSAVLQLLRLKQWIKNLFVFAPLIFSLNLFHRDLLLLTVETFFAFSLVASAVYVINDIIDLDKDLHHPTKKKRPLPAGRISIGSASILGIICLVAGVVLALTVNAAVLGIVAVYTALNLYYSLHGKNVIILDAMIIAIGFVLRVLAGAFAIAVHASSWLLVATFFVSLLLGLAKRFNEMRVLQERSVNHRQVLDEYNEALLRQMLSVASGSTVVSYALYTMDRDVIATFGTGNLVYTLPFVVYGVYRYLYLVFKQEEGGDPTELVLKDKPMLVNLALWAFTVILIIYRF